ncbi:hypothetical protein BT69DRAFT_516837 [Atractiella rhizophila]|nr:hypothetical protein BT69DRAFT_516837 [Atractiella rhizophila]
MSLLLNEEPTKGYALVLINGDSYMFSSSLFNKGIADAGAAASNEVEGWLQKSGGLPPVDRVLLHIFWRRGKIIRWLEEFGVKKPVKRIDQFVSTFGRGQPSFSMTEVPDEEEAILRRVEICVETHASHDLCRAVVFAGMEEASFLPILQRCKLLAQQVRLLTMSSTLPPSIQRLNFPLLDLRESGLFQNVHPADENGSRAERTFSVEQSSFAEPASVSRRTTWAGSLPVQELKPTGLMGPAPRFSASGLEMDPDYPLTEQSPPLCPEFYFDTFLQKGRFRCSRVDCRFSHDYVLTPQERGAFSRLWGHTKCKGKEHCQNEQRTRCPLNLPLAIDPKKPLIFQTPLLCQKYYRLNASTKYFSTNALPGHCDKVHNDSEQLSHSYYLTFEQRVSFTIQLLHSDCISGDHETCPITASLFGQKAKCPFNLPVKPMTKAMRKRKARADAGLPTKKSKKKKKFNHTGNTASSSVKGGMKKEEGDSLAK